MRSRISDSTTKSPSGTSPNNFDASNLEEDTDSFTPPPALSPAYSTNNQELETEEKFLSEKNEALLKTPNILEEGERQIQDVEDHIKKENKVKAPKMKYKKRSEKEKDAVPFLDPNAPKRNRSAYVHFIVHRRASYSKAVMSQRDINIALAADWQKLTTDERIPFHQKAEEEKKKYTELMEEYRKTESHKEFQKKRAKILSAQSKQRKRKHGEDSDNNEVAGVKMTFPKPSAFCPLLNTPQCDPSSSTSSSSVQYLGPIFTPEFMSYNKIRDSYRRQLAVERSNVEHELEALNQYDIDVRIAKQEERLQNVDSKIADAMTKMRLIFGGVSGAKEHFGSIDVFTDWLGTLTRMGQNHGTRKAVKESINKNGKIVIALRK